MPRSTKIVATLGPASSDPVVLERMIRAGVDVVRLNFSHGSAADHEQRAALVKSIASKTGRTVAIMCDLQGPKIRVGRFKDGKITLEKGQRFVLDAACELGDSDRAGLDYKELPRDVEPGAVLLLDDGKIVLEVTAVKGSEVHTVVRHGGVLSNNKGINRQGGGLTAAALTAKDMEDIRTAVKIQADYLAVSFPKSGADMYMARELMRAAGGNAFLIAKIERAEAVAESALVDIMRGSDGIMVARGDLAVEVGDAAVPALQKKMIRLGREHNKLTITATQMMESMISSAVWMSRLNAGVPIYALTSQTSTRYRCALFREVFPLMVKYVGHDREELLREAEKVLVENKVVKAGDLIVLTIGEPIGKAGGTNTMKIVRVGEHRTP